ncbi:MAG: DNA/RNA non-specific endonuclease [Bacteroidales bacterium]|nr:DNA/RNA non-specific endonuclease [Bacteroidales bacterium]MBN2821422.1 DNA/RNA non-specific endonuclease [Bacteroidales bacterium]
MKKIILIVLLFVGLKAANSQNIDIMLPSEMPRESLIHHKTFSLSYNTSYALPSWVAYKVTNKNVDKTSGVSNNYKEDPDVNIRAANKKDYKDGGYLMCQLLNYLDVMHINDATDETFYMTNIVPMKLAFYNHIWLTAEDLIRLWISTDKGFEVFTGPVIKADAPFTTMGKNKVSIPNRYYKVVYDPVNKKAVGFVFRNGKASGTMKSYSLPVDEIEELTGIDFLPGLSEEEQNAIESTVDYSFWNFELEEELK